MNPPFEAPAYAPAVGAGGAPGGGTICAQTHAPCAQAAQLHHGQNIAEQCVSSPWGPSPVAMGYTPPRTAAGMNGIHTPHSQGEHGCAPDTETYTEWPDHLKRVQYPSVWSEEKKLTIDYLSDTPHDGGDIHTDTDSVIQDDTTLCDWDNNQNAQFDCYFNWPFPHREMDPHTALIYDKVRSQGVPNYKGAKVPLPSPLKHEAWVRESTGHEQDHELMQGIKYGFPIQYTGGPLYGAQTKQNHPSAQAYKGHIDQYFEKECALRAIDGPFKDYPFTPWCIVSPLMTRPKSEEGKRRVIVDLSFPNGGVNAYIQHHMFNGEQARHSLPTITDLTNLLEKKQNQDTMLAVIDISRAYRHFQVFPLDWPLLVLVHDQQYYFDRSLPFGARTSAYVMQSVAQFIIRALDAKGIEGLMYLDDLILVSPTAMAKDHYAQALELLESLGLAVAHNKLQPPNKCVTWLGIRVDLQLNEVSIPPAKLAEIQRGLEQASRQKSLTKKQLQRAIGQINHLSKVVPPARLFMARLLEAMRGTRIEHIPVTKSMAADLSWFRRFLKEYNGKAIIPTNKESRQVWADACLEGAGATDGTYCYSYSFTRRLKNNHHITHLEAINCLAAARTFTTKEDQGKIVIINCDNLPAVYAFKGGRAKDPVLNACARAFWYLAAGNQVSYQFNHVPGQYMDVPDALSRVMLSQEFKDKAARFVADMSLEYVDVTHKAFAFSSFFF